MATHVLLDECLPRSLAAEFTGHTVTTVPDAGWSGKSNGELLDLAEGSFEVLVTIDQGIQFQQNISGRSIAVIAFSAPTNRVEDLRPLMHDALAILESIEPGHFYRIAH